MHLTKHHGLGNDFLVTFVDEVPPDAPAIAAALCDRRTGLGADGLIFGTQQGSDPHMTLFNSDGSRAEVSGNGLRCFAQAVAMRRGITHLDLDVHTDAGVRRCTVDPTDDPAVADASADMGPVTAGDRPDDDDFVARIVDMPSVQRWSVGAVGNPHVVIETPDPHAVDLARVGPQVEDHFPHGVNVHFVRRSNGDEADGIELRVWERGAGITRACGSGATVSAQRAHEWGLVGERVEVAMPGGVAIVEVMTDDRPTAILRGPATFVAAVEVPRG